MTSSLLVNATITRCSTIPAALGHTGLGFSVGRAYKLKTTERRPQIVNGGQSKRAWRRRLLHRIFELGVIAKGIDGALELVGGLLLLFLSPVAITGAILLLVQGELKEDPTDLVANLLVHSTGTIIKSRVPASGFLILHGTVKLALVAGLATNKLWSYPAAIAVFTGFAIYQIYQLVQQKSVFLGIVTALDIVVVLLISGEYRHVKSARQHAY
jgi:uncharacterized membrane protein